jgi:hypothetical protein
LKENPTSTDKLIESLKKESRYCILECAVFIEEKVSDTLGRILEIDWKESESIGYGTGSLGFENKLRLIQDLKGVTKEDKTKFQSFMAIRNKFAHIAEIDSFSNYFKIISSSKDRQKELKKWFPNLKWDSKNIEGVYKFSYFLLTLNLFRVLFDIDMKHAFKKGEDQGRKEAQDIFIKHVKNRLQETKDGSDILEETIEKIINKNGG